MKSVLASLIPLLFIAFAPATHAAGSVTEGVNYQLVQPAQPPMKSSGKIEVIEMFWYGCPHCHRFQAHLDRWLKAQPDNVEFIRIPVILRENWGTHARAFFTAQALGKLEEIHMPFFEAIHNEKRRLNTNKSLMEFFAEHGISNDDFRKTFNSFSVNSKVRRAQQFARKYGIQGTPSVVVAGKYRIDTGMGKQGFPGVIKAINHLIALEGDS